MSGPAWMPFYVGDYLKDTANLGALEHGAYLLLILHYWQHGGLPRNDDELATISRVGIADWPRVRKRLRSFFLNGWRHKRIDAELKKSRDIIKKRKEAGAAGIRARERNRQANAYANGHANDKQRSTQSQSPSTTSTDVDVVPRKRGHRLPEDWVLSRDDEAWAITRGMSRERIANAATKFKNHWLSKTGAGATKLNWSRTWQNWVLSDLERSGQRAPPKRNGAAKLSDLLTQPFSETYGNGRSNDQSPAAPAVRQLRDR